jgi:hypothetical protein
MYRLGFCGLYCVRPLREKILLFTDEFIEKLRADPVSGTIELCDLTIKELKDNGREDWTEEDFAILVEAYSLLAELMETGLLPIKVKLPSIENGSSDQCPNLFGLVNFVRDACKAEEAKLRVTALRSRFRVSLGSGFAYEFSQGDLDRVQDLVNQLRSLISAATNLDKEHQQRLLRRLEKLQSELHKKVSDLDRFWGLIGDAGVVLGKLGNDAKPIVDRIRDIADIVWQTQSRAEELPSGTKLPQLEHKPTSGGEEA